MENIFVPSDLAKGLKDLGFNEPCLGYYYYPYGKDKEFFLLRGMTLGTFKPDLVTYESPDLYGGENCYLTPTWEQLFDWFFKTKKILILKDFQYYDGCLYVYKAIYPNGMVKVAIDDKSELGWFYYPEDARYQLLKKLIDGTL